jgi:DNA-directed RNA polymerase specialized sigma24 family protein
MIFSTSSIIYLQKDRIEPNEKITKDASAVRILEIMDQAMESLADEDRRAWEWRYSEGMTLEEVGQMIADAPRGCRDAVTFWRMKAKRKLDHVALVLARKMWRGA